MSGSFPDCWSARQSIAKGKFAAICDETSMKKAISWDFSTSGKCHLYIAREPVYTNTMMAIAFRRNSSFLPLANKLIRTIKEAGILNKWLSEEITNTSQCLKPPTSDRQEAIAPLGLKAFSGPMIFVIAGWTVALLIYNIELLATRCLNHHETKTSSQSKALKHNTD